MTLDTEELPRSPSWSERISFVECPYCEHSHCLGDARVYGDYEDTCDNCKKPFIIEKDSDVG